MRGHGPKLLSAPMACFLVGLCALFGGCHRSAGPVADIGTAPLPGIPAFAKVSPVLYRGDQPEGREAFAELKRRGIKTIICLRTLDYDRSDMAGLGLRYLHLSVKPGHPEDEDVALFLLAVCDPANQPVFVHCRQGVDRTGIMVAAYRIMVEGWSNRRALAEMEATGFHEGFLTFARYIKHMDRVRLRRQIDVSPSPRVEVLP